MDLAEFLNLRYRTVLTPIPPEDGGGWLVEAPDLPGCTSDGQSPEEALTNFEDAKREWFGAAINHGARIPIPETDEVHYSGKFTLRLPRSLHREIAQAAVREGISQNQYIISLVSHGFGFGRSANRTVSFEQTTRVEGIMPNPDLPTPLDQIPRILPRWGAANVRADEKA